MLQRLLTKGRVRTHSNTYVTCTRVFVPCIALQNGLARHDHEQAEDAVEMVEVFQRSFRPMRIRTYLDAIKQLQALLPS